jgi:hypothetical protein
MMNKYEMQDNTNKDSDYYRVIVRHEEDILEFQEHVAEYVATGWKCVGGVSVRTGAVRGAYLIQAVSKHPDD